MSKTNPHGTAYIGVGCLSPRGFQAYERVRAAYGDCEYTQDFRLQIAAFESSCIVEDDWKQCLLMIDPVERIDNEKFFEDLHKHTRIIHESMRMENLQATALNPHHKDSIKAHKLIIQIQETKAKQRLKKAGKTK